MPRLYFTLTCFMLITLSLLATLALTLGTTQPPNPALADFGFCSDIPCWMDTDMQTYDLQVMNVSLAADGYRGNLASGFYESLDNRCDVQLMSSFYNVPVFSSLRLVNCRDLRLGDVINIFGIPGRVVVDSFCHWVLEYSRHVFVTVDGRIPPHLGYVTLLPSHPITDILFDREAGTYANGSQWHGFVPLWRYRQYEPEARFDATCN